MKKYSAVEMDLYNIKDKTTTIKEICEKTGINQNTFQSRKTRYNNANNKTS